MKTSIFTTLNVIFAMFLFTPHVYAQVADAPSTNTIQKAAAAEMVISIIDVQGTRFNDRMWIFSVPECTPYFDNGWDGYKMFVLCITHNFLPWAKMVIIRFTQ